MSRHTSFFPRPRPEKPLYYFLRDGKPVPAEGDEEAFAAFLCGAEGRIVNDTFLCALDGTEIRICTGFLCFDENWPSDDGDPVLWETTIFWPGNELDYWIKRYTSAEAARVGHEEAVALVNAALASSI